MFHFFIILSIFTIVFMIIFTITYINKLQSKIDSLIDALDEMDLIDATALQKKIIINKKKNEQRHKR